MPRLYLRPTEVRSSGKIQAWILFPGDCTVHAAKVAILIQPLKGSWAGYRVGFHLSWMSHREACFRIWALGTERPNLHPDSATYNDPHWSGREAPRFHKQAWILLSITSPIWTWDEWSIKCIARVLRNSGRVWWFTKLGNGKPWLSSVDWPKAMTLFAYWFTAWARAGSSLVTSSRKAWLIAS